jgi:hypothetical protein
VKKESRAEDERKHEPQNNGENGTCSDLEFV